MDARATHHNMNMLDEIGFSPDSQNEYKCRPCIHMDAFRYNRSEELKSSEFMNTNGIIRGTSAGTI